MAAERSVIDAELFGRIRSAIHAALSDVIQQDIRGHLHEASECVDELERRLRECKRERNAD